MREARAIVVLLVGLGVAAACTEHASTTPKTVVIETGHEPPAAI